MLRYQMFLGVLIGFLIAANSSQAQPARPGEAKSDVLPPINHEPVELSEDEKINAAVYQQANRSVVHITTRGVQVDDFLFSVTPRQGSGSGTVLSKEGHILTNFHVIEEAQRIAVTVYNGNTYPAKLVGIDPNNDLAVIRIDAPPSRLHPIPWGDSNKAVVGMRVFALGNPFGLERTLTTGIVSSLNRTLRTENQRVIRGVIQTDAAINPGNSGGPLLNRRGELIGITTAIISKAGQSSGVGLAIPSNVARRVTEELIRHGRVIRGDIGISSVLPLEEGLLITRLVPEGPAEKAGLRGPEVKVVEQGGFLFRSVDRSKADVILGVNGRPVRDVDEFLTLVESNRPGSRVQINVLREGQTANIDVVLGGWQGEPENAKRPR